MMGNIFNIKMTFIWETFLFGVKTFQFILTFLGARHVWSKGLLSHKMSNEDGNKRPQYYLDKTQQKSLNWTTKLRRRWENKPKILQWHDLRCPKFMINVKRF